MPLEHYIKLELGAGDWPSWGGFVHNDIVPAPHIEIVADCRQLPMVGSASVTFLRAIHLLEHFKPSDAQAALAEWVRVLCPGGVLELAMPNIPGLALLLVLGTISPQAFLRDLYGDTPPPDPLPVDLSEAAKALATGVRSFKGKEGWNYLLSLLYKPVWDREGVMVHRWAYCQETLHEAMIAAGLCGIEIQRDGTSFRAWGQKR